jgi:cysteinyl-tRNA synthetase
MERVAELEAVFDADPAAAILELEAELVAWSRDTTQSDELDRGRAALRAMVVRLGESARPVEPFVEALVSARSSLRSAGLWDEADEVRRALERLGVEVQDSKEGSTWRLLS